MKKTLFVFVLAAIVAMMASCSGSGNNSKTITATGTEFETGQVSKFIELVSQSTELTYTEKNDYQYLRFTLTLKLVRDGIKDVDARDIGFIRYLGVLGVELVDESGSRITTVELRNEDDLKFKKFLTGNEGDTAEFVFEYKFGNAEMAQQEFKEAVQFTPALASDIVVNDVAYVMP